MKLLALLETLHDPDRSDVRWAVDKHADKMMHRRGREFVSVWVNIRDLMTNTFEDQRLDLDDPVGGRNSIGNRVAGAKSFWAAGHYMDPSWINVGPEGDITFVDGRHRLVAAYQMGHRYAPVLLDPQSLERLQELPVRIKGQDLNEAKSGRVTISNKTRNADIQYWINPIKTDIESLVATHSTIRGMINEEALIVWKAYEATHQNMSNALHFGQEAFLEITGPYVSNDYEDLYDFFVIKQTPTMKIVADEDISQNPHAIRAFGNIKPMLGESNLNESQSFTAYFWYQPSTKRYESVDGTHTAHAYYTLGYTLGRGDSFGDEDPEIIGAAIQDGWVRGINLWSEIKLEGKLKEVWMTAKAIAKQHPIKTLVVDLHDMGEQKQNQWGYRTRNYLDLKGDRLEFFLKTGRVPSRMVQENLTEAKIERIQTPHSSDLLVYVNPTRLDLIQLSKRIEVLRGVVDQDQMVVWNAFDGIHDEVANYFSMLNPAHFYLSNESNDEERDNFTFRGRGLVVSARSRRVLGFPPMAKLAQNMGVSTDDPNDISDAELLGKLNETVLTETPYAPLYHFTMIYRMGEIVKQDTLGLKDTGVFTQHGFFKRHPGQVSLTRNPTHVFGKNSDVVLVLDQGKLRQRYRLEQQRGDDPSYRGNFGKREAEERLYGPITNLHNYLTAIYIDPYESDDSDYRPPQDVAQALYRIRDYAKRFNIPLLDIAEFRGRRR